ncbi:MAG: hypothetical protein P8N31_09320 [Planctomycetota bacterium]|nr:hypothetical protein [Planctomycetota bacterium]MDG2143742.1 hypothetical protein [Planctomycetota bacterium]
MPVSPTRKEPEVQAQSANPAAPPLGLQNLKGLRSVVLIMMGYLLLASIVAAIGYPYLGKDEVSDPGEGDGVLSALLLAIGLMIPLEFVAFLAVRKSLRKQLAVDLAETPYRRGDGLPMTYVTICMIGVAMTLSVGFFGVVIYLISGSITALAIAGGAAVLLFVQLPTDDSLRSS